MAILKADKTQTINGVKVHEYLLTNHNPNRIAMPTASMEGKILGVTIHNTDWITTASGTTPAEQYTRATVNGNMNDVRVHYYVDNTCAWQNLPHSLSGWHAADGSGNGNRRTIAIECIMSSAYNSVDQKSEDNAARLAAYLLYTYKLGIDRLYTHTHWLNVRDGRTGTVDQLNVMKHSYKMCPLYILPHWNTFKQKVQNYLNALNTAPAPTPTTSETPATELYRVRKSWADAASQIGAFANLENAKKICKSGYAVFDSKGNKVYEVVTRQFIAGAKVQLTNANFYVSASSTNIARSNVNGVYYLWNTDIINGRVRITNTPENANKVGQVTAWVDKSQVQLI